ALENRAPEIVAAGFNSFVLVKLWNRLAVRNHNKTSVSSFFPLMQTQKYSCLKEILLYLTFNLGLSLKNLRKELKT
ncbi:MAG: hypothetical protein VXV86_00165, partial [Verrucomicrobiota bacterium]|nr:hypothetical protein [Verrucomicrobiota bacterium]